MDVKKLLELVEQAQAENMDLYKFAAKIIEYQKEVDATLLETLGHADSAAIIRAT